MKPRNSRYRDPDALHDRIIELLSKVALRDDGSTVTVGATAERGK